MNANTIIAATLAAAATASAGQGSFTVATWNIGHFSMGMDAISKLPAVEAEKWRAAYRDFLDPIGARLLFVEEYSPWMDTEKTIRAAESVFAGYEVALEGPSGGGGHVNSIFANGCEVADSGVRAYAQHYQNTNYHFLLTAIDGLETLVVATHLEPNWPENHAVMRAAQMRELLEAVGDFPRVIIGADWNVDSPDEWKVLEEAGFAMANDGSLPTAFSWDPKMAIDNVIVRGFAVSDVRVHTDKRLSDHCLLSCVLTPTDRSDAADSGLPPRHKPFLTTEERMVWKDMDISRIEALSGILQGRWIPIQHVARGVITERTGDAMTVQFQTLDGYCKAVRVHFRQQGADIVASADKAGFSDKAYFGKPMPDEAFGHELATAADNGTYGIRDITPSEKCPIVWR